MIAGKLTVFILLCLIFLTNFLTESLINTEKNSEKAKAKQKKKNAGTYKQKEEIEKAPSEDHPCNLTRTSVKISFPEMKGELFVNLLGYKEPNLVHLWRCKGNIY